MKNSGYTFNSNGAYEEINNEMLADVINNPKKYIKTIFGSWPVKTPYDIVDLDGYRLRLLLNQTYKVNAGEEFHRVYPDVIMEVTAHYSHNPVIEYDNKGNGIKYYLTCPTCDNITGDIYSGERVVNLLTISNSEVSNLIKESSEQESYSTFFNMALEKAEQIGYRLQNLHDDLFYQQFGGDSEECFTWNYYAFIKTSPYVPSLVDTLRELKSENSVGREHSYPEPSKLNSAHYGYSDHKNSTFRGTFLLTPDLRYRNEFENQGIKVIPYDFQEDKVRMADERFKSGSDSYDRSKKYSKSED